MHSEWSGRVATHGSCWDWSIRSLHVSDFTTERSSHLCVTVFAVRDCWLESSQALHLSALRLIKAIDGGDWTCFGGNIISRQHLRWRYIFRIVSLEVDFSFCQSFLVDCLCLSLDYWTNWWWLKLHKTTKNRCAKVEKKILFFLLKLHIADVICSLLIVKYLNYRVRQMSFKFTAANVFQLARWPPGVIADVTTTVFSPISQTARCYYANVV